MFNNCFTIISLLLLLQGMDPIDNEELEIAVASLPEPPMEPEIASSKSGQLMTLTYT